MNEGLGDKSPNEKAVEKPVSEMTAEELRAALAAKESEEATAAETPDMSYVDMASAEKPEPSPEEREVLNSKIEEQENALQGNIAELAQVSEMADQAELGAEQKLSTNENDLGAKLVLKRIEEAYRKAQNSLNEYTRVAVGTIGGSLIGGSLLSLDSTNHLTMSDVTTVGVVSGVLGAAVYGLVTAFNKYRSRKEGVQFAT